MNQDEAACVIADYLTARADSVTIGRAMEGEHPTVVMVGLAAGGVVSVTVEILAQP